jgi:hypothetical protein
MPKRTDKRSGIPPPNGMKNDERTTMVNIGVLAPLFPHDMLTIAAVCIGGLTIAATLYAYIYDYAVLSKES